MKGMQHTSSKQRAVPVQDFTSSKRERERERKIWTVEERDGTPDSEDHK
jgi:hypothetical protein